MNLTSTLSVYILHVWVFHIKLKTPVLSSLSVGWPPSPQASAQVTYKSSSKPRARFLSGPVSLSICLYLSPFHHYPPHDSGALLFLSFTFNTLLLCCSSILISHSFLPFTFGHLSVNNTLNLTFHLFYHFNFK